MSEVYSPAGNVSAQSYKRATVAEAATGTFGDEFMRQDMTQIADRIRYLSDLGYLTFPAVFAAQADPNTLDDYEEGAWTPTDASGASLTFSAAGGSYEKIGRLVIARGTVTYPATANGSAAILGSLPFTLANTTETRQGFISWTDAPTLARAFPIGNAVTVPLFDASGNTITNITLSLKSVFFTVIYHI